MAASTLAYTTLDFKAGNGAATPGQQAGLEEPAEETE